MKFFILIIFAFGITPAHSKNDDSSILKYVTPYLLPNNEFFSPNKKYICYTVRKSNGELNLYIQKGKSDFFLHSTMRSLGVEWSPNSNWLAVIDNYAPSNNQILIYDITMSPPLEVYKTPVNYKEDYYWMVIKWNEKNRKIIINGIADKTGIKTSLKINLQANH
jgi:hypothetical protein